MLENLHVWFNLKNFSKKTISSFNDDCCCHPTNQLVTFSHSHVDLQSIFSSISKTLYLKKLHFVQSGCCHLTGKFA